MPRIFDNIEQHLSLALSETMAVSDHADFCVGYFNLRGWRSIDEYVERWQGGPNHCCRLLVGMQRLPQEDLRIAKGLSASGDSLDNKTALQLKIRLAAEFREQLMIGAPTNEDEAGLRRLEKQIKEKKVVVKLFLQHPLHAKLYLLFRSDPVNPTVGYLGSSNLTQSGLSLQGELNIDVLDHDACQKLARWFEDRWVDRWCIDISAELAQIINESWARKHTIPPFHIYVKVAYHLSQEARAGLTDFRIPSDFANKLLDFQVAAVKIAAHHLNKRGGVIIGDVVGLGKTLMATALARVFEDDYDLETLIICPKNLVRMWEDYKEHYRMRARVLSISQVIGVLPDMRRYRLVIVDESHNLRNRAGKRYRALQEYIRANDSKCILLSATPYNKTYLDLSSQLRLFVSENDDLGIRPERLLRKIGETEFIRQYQAPARSLAAFERSPYADDWRELMRLYLVRRTRSFIQNNYAATDPENGRPYLTFDDGSKSYFPARIPKTVQLDSDRQYSRMFARNVVDTIARLELPRYGLGNYVAPSPHSPPAPGDAQVLDDLSRAGKRLMGFCRTNLFKRLESSGYAFLLSLERHILRNFVFLYAIENDKPLPIGPTDAGFLDTSSFDGDVEESTSSILEDDDTKGETPVLMSIRMEQDFRRRAAEIYALYTTQYRKRFRWLSSHHFVAKLESDLLTDASALRGLLDDFGDWDPNQDAKLAGLHKLLVDDHSNHKILIFTQFADTGSYLVDQLRAHGVAHIDAVSGSSADPTGTAWRFSPKSNDKENLVPPGDEIRVLVTTDVLSEGQNLQDCAIVVNYDLPWAIIRLIQRAGRVDRIGQNASQILCYSFLPADGIEHLIQLRERVRRRLDQNAEVVGTDEAFFENDDHRAVLDLYNEKTGILDADDETDVDLSSYAYQIWRNATAADPALKRIIEDMPDVVYSSKAHMPATESPDGVLVYIRTTHAHDTLAWLDRNGNSVTESQFKILRAARCRPGEPSLLRHATHHALVQNAAEHIAAEGNNAVGGQLGRPSSARFRTYERLKNYIANATAPLVADEALRKAIDDIYRHPLRHTAVDALNRQLRSGASDEALAELVIGLRDNNRLSAIVKEGEQQEPQIICSLGLVDSRSE